MKLVATSYKYLKQYPALSMLTLCSIIVASLLEGASFGMLIPLIQSMVSGSPEIFEKIPFLKVGLRFLPSMSQSQNIIFVFVLILLLLVGKNIFVYLSNISIAKLRFRAIYDLRSRLMRNILRYDIQYFDRIKIGDVIGNITTETERIGHFLMSVLQFIALSVRVLAYVSILFVLSWKMSIMVFLLMGVVLVPVEFIMKRIKRSGQTVSVAINKFNYKLTEILGGIRLIRNCGMESHESEKFANVSKDLSQVQYKTNKLIHSIIPLSEVSIFAIIVICISVLISHTKIDFVTIFPYLMTYLLILTRTLTQLNALNATRSDAMSSLAALDIYEEMIDKSGKLTIITGNKEINTLKEGIEFRNVNFSYAKDKPVIENLDLVIPANSVTALVGPSGSGKSTLVNLILRYYDVGSGEILIDGINLKELDLHKWRKGIGFVSQDIFIFNTSVKTNIMYGSQDVADEEIIQAAQAAHAHEFIMRLPDKYDTILGERGVKLSGGEKQRISIARAIINNPDILMLDEATSSLDTETERLITEAISRLTKDRTVIAIAHRLSTIFHANDIIVLDKGRVIESGKHGELLSKEGLYKKLFDMQFSI